MRFAYITLALVVIISTSVHAQKETEFREQTWLGYFNQTRLTNKSGIWFDVHYRLTGNFVDETAINIVRIGYTYFVSDHVRVTAGYGYIKAFSHNGVTPNQPEHRPWQQVQWLEKKKGFNLAQYFRIEERYRRTIVANELTDDYAFNWRFRYNFAITIPLKGNQVVAKTPFLFLNDELHINAGKRIVNNYFDQNRLFIGVGYQFTSHLNAQIGYLNVFQQLPAGNRYVNIDAVRLFVFHNLDFRSAE